MVHPSLPEEFGLLPVEAMTCGCPVIPSAVALHWEICDDAAIYYESGVWALSPKEYCASCWPSHSAMGRLRKGRNRTAGTPIIECDETEFSE